MNVTFSKKYFLLLTLLSPQQGNSQWTGIPVPTIEVPIAAFTVAAHGDTLLAGTYRSTIYRSTDHGTTWIESGSGLSPSVNQIPALLIVGGMVFAGTNEGVYRSTDWGDHWTLRGGMVSYVGSLACSDTTLYAVSTNGIFRSRDWGGSWQADNAGIPTVGPGTIIPVSAIAAVDSLLLLACRDGVYRRKTSGSVWEAANNGIPVDGLYHAAGRSISAHDGRAYFGTGFCGGSVFYSSDNGDSWSSLSSGLPTTSGGCYLDVFSLLFNDSLLFAGTSYGVYRSSDGGKSWEAFNKGLPLGPASDLHVPSMTLTSTQLLASTFGGIYRCTFGYSVWSPVFVGFPGRAHVGVLGGSGGSLFALAEADYFNGIISRSYHSSDRGASWGVDTSSVLGRTSHFFNLAKEFYAAGAGLFVSSDDGSHWTEIDSGLFAVDALVSNDTTMIAGYGGYFLNDDMGAVYRSTNKGLRWDSAGLQGVPVRALAMSGNIVVAQSKGIYAPFALHRSTDIGSTWSRIDSLLPHGIEVSSLAVSEGILFAGTNHGVLSSYDMGTTWRAACNGLPSDSTGSYQGVSILYHNGSISAIDKTLFCAIGPRLYMTMSGGTIWEAIDEGLPGSGNAVVAVTAGNTDLAISTGYDVWRRPLSDIISAIPTTSFIPLKFALEQNYPNPFNPRTTIRYVLSERSDVRLTLYNTLGQKVRTLVQATQEPGPHEAALDGLTLASGVYFYTLEAGRYVMTKKAMLIR